MLVKFKTAVGLFENQLDIYTFRLQKKVFKT